MQLFHRKDPDTEHKKQAIRTLLDNSHHHRDFYILLVGAALLAAGGIFADSIPVLIASMIVAPLAYPILTLGLSIVVGDVKLLGYTALLFLGACLLTLAIAAGATFAFNDIRVNDIYVTFTENLYLAAAVAVISGGIGAFGLIRPRISSAITGVAIAVSLMPPLVATGVGLASNDADLTSSASMLFGLNVVGILVASIVVFSLYGLKREYQSLQ